MKQVLKGMHFNQNDLELLHYLHTVKVSTYDRIQRDVYPDHKIKSVCARIYRLEANKLVQGQCNRMLSHGQRLISLTKQGFRQFVSDGYEKRMKLKSDALHHDLGLSDLRFLAVETRSSQSVCI